MFILIWFRNTIVLGWVNNAGIRFINTLISDEDNCFRLYFRCCVLSNSHIKTDKVGLLCNPLYVTWVSDAFHTRAAIGLYLADSHNLHNIVICLGIEWSWCKNKKQWS